MKIIHVPRRFVLSDWGGTESVVLESSKAMIQQGHESVVWTPAIFSNPGNDTINGVPVRRFSYSYPYWGLSPENKRRLDQKGGNLFSFSLWRALRGASDVGVLHLHTSKRLGGIVRSAAQHLRVPYLVSLHGGLLDMPGSEAASFTEPTKGSVEWGKALGWLIGSRRTMDDAAMLICVGKQEARLVAERYPNKRVEYVPNGVDPDRFTTGDGAGFRARYGIGADRKVVLLLGRMDPQKNQLFLLELLPRLRERLPDAYVLMIGPSTNDAYADKIRSALSSPGVSGHAQWLPGFPPGSSDLVDAYHAADVFALPSVHEPFGIVILEAWCAQRPVVASNIGGIPGFVTHDHDALLAPVNDGAAWLDALHALLSQTDLAQRLAAAGERTAHEQYSWASVATRMIGLYEEARRAYPVR